MKTIFFREVKINTKQFLIWSLVVGGLGLACLLMYQSMQGDVQKMADMFSQMGAFSAAFGMSTLSIATVKGFFATEVGTVHGLGGGMFAAIIAIGILSKEEEGHTGEFLYALPVSRKRVVASKGICVLVLLVAFTLITGLLYALGFVLLGEELPLGEFMTFLLCQLLMDVEIASICFAVSAFSGKNRMGLGIGLTLIFYLYDIIGRVVPALKDYLFVGPHSYANASEILAGKATPGAGLILAAVIAVGCGAWALIRYDRRDLAS